jgi:hypothetical protein
MVMFNKLRGKTIYDCVGIIISEEICLPGRDDM